MTMHTHCYLRPEETSCIWGTFQGIVVSCVQAAAFKEALVYEKKAGGPLSSEALPEDVIGQSPSGVWRPFGKTDAPARLRMAAKQASKGAASSEEQEKKLRKEAEAAVGKTLAAQPTQRAEGGSRSESGNREASRCAYCLSFPPCAFRVWPGKWRSTSP